MDVSTPAESPNFPHCSNAESERVYFVPYRWLKEEDVERDKGVLYTASTASCSSYAAVPMKIINNIFNSDFVFNLRREDSDDAERIEKSEEGVSGRDYALVLQDVWLETFKWHSNTNALMRNGGSSPVAEDGMADVYPLQLRLSMMREANQLCLKISKRDNAVDLYKRACKIFTAESEPIRIWDFSGQMNLYFVGERNNIWKDCQRQSDQEILLELQVYGLSDSVKCRSEGKKDELVMQQSKMTAASFAGSPMSNGNAGNIGSMVTKSSSLNGSCGMGLMGLQNLGNTCFMNSAIQCLVHTEMLAEYFLRDYSREINQHNPLGMGGELALAFGELLRKLWAPGTALVAPRSFKTTLSRFAPQFSGFNQHDSQELLAFLLDGLHEDLNRVKCKPYMEAKDANGRADEEVADEYWANHQARNDSIIVDVCQGQYRSTLVCPVCNKVSITFDPFMYLSLPLPSTTMRTMTVTVFSTDGSTQPIPYIITVPKNGKCRDLIQALSIACSLSTDENLLVAEVYANRIIRYLEEPSDSITLIRDADRLAAYRLPNDLEKLPLVVFMHQCMENGKITSSWKAFGTPLVTRLCNVANGSDIHHLFQNLLSPFRRQKETEGNSIGSAIVEGVAIDDATSLPVSVCVNPSDVSTHESYFDNMIEFYLTNEKGITKDFKVERNESLSIPGSSRWLHVLACWQDKAIEQYDTRLLSPLPEIFKPGFPKRPQESISLYSCLEAFLKEEPLGPEDMWYCPCCKIHQQASKKLDLWRLPEILVIHLKRFLYSRFMKNKLEAFVDFPIHDLDLSSYIAHKNGRSLNCYELYAVSNHYGSMGGGHYTAYVNHKGWNQWHEFDDSNVFPITEEKIKTSAAYVLFYRRVRHRSPTV